MRLERLDDVGFEPDQHADRVFVGAAADVVGIPVRRRDDLTALGVRRLGEAALVDEEGGLLLGTADDPLRFLLGLLDDPLALGVDPLRRADLFRHGDPQLIDETERRVLVDDDVRRQRQLLAIRDERFEALDEKDDVDLIALLVADGRPVAGPDYGTTASDQRLARASARAVRAASGNHRGHVAAEGRDLLDQARADVAVGDGRS